MDFVAIERPLTLDFPYQDKVHGNFPNESISFCYVKA
jgi:hypothetical protein